MNSPMNQKLGMNLTVENSPKALHPYLVEINSLYRVYVRVMDLKRRRDTIRGVELALDYGYVAWAYGRDVWFNLTTGTRIFNDPARELMFTARLKRYRLGHDQAKAALAEFLCDEWLDEVDPDGDHC
jgi:hypothetical protein